MAFFLRLLGRKNMNFRRFFTHCAFYQLLFIIIIIKYSHFFCILHWELLFLKNRQNSAAGPKSEHSARCETWSSIIIVNTYRTRITNTNSNSNFYPKLWKNTGFWETIRGRTFQTPSFLGEVCSLSSLL